MTSGCGFCGFVAHFSTEDMYINPKLKILPLYAIHLIYCILVHFPVEMKLAV